MKLGDTLLYLQIATRVHLRSFADLEGDIIDGDVDLDQLTSSIPHVQT